MNKLLLLTVVLLCTVALLPDSDAVIRQCQCLSYCRRNYRYRHGNCGTGGGYNWRRQVKCCTYPPRSGSY